LKSNKRVISALLLAAFSIGAVGINASAATVVPKASKLSVVTTTKTAKITWAAFAKGKVTAIKVVAAAGSSKITKTVPAKSTSYTFTNLKSKTTYTFSVFGLRGSKSSSAVSVKARTKVELYYNSIFLGQPEDMLVGEAEQALFALPNGGVTAFESTTPTVCTIVNDSYIRPIAMGTCTIVASNPGDSQYAAAADEIRTLTVTVPIDSLEKTLLWSDEFSEAAGSGPSANNWVIETGDGCDAAPGCGWGNGESQSYAACAIKQDGAGIMTITSSTPTGDPTCTSNRNWTSGKFTTYGKQHFGYGYFEARLRMPAGGGTWPAFWTLGTNISTVPWPNSGELDIMEYAGNSPNRSTSAAHYANSGGVHEYKSGGKTLAAPLSDDYHTYAMLWLPNEITFLVDGKPSFILNKKDTGLTNWPFGPNASGVNPKMYLILNLAMGGNYGGQIKSGYTKATFDIDYVRYYSVNGFGSAPTN
jgi:beta-glucanase (GH16 family)